MSKLVNESGYGDPTQLLDLSNLTGYGPVPNVNDPSGSGLVRVTVNGNGDISQSDPNRTVLQDVFGEKTDGSLIGHPLNDFPFDITSSWKLTLLGWVVVGGIGLLILSFFRRGKR